MLNFSSYSAGLGTLQQEEVDQLRKALEIGYTIPSQTPADPGLGAAYRVESLDRTLYAALWDEDSAPMFRMIPKSPANSVVEEYNVLLSYGDERTSLFVPEIALPEEQNSTIQRRLTRIKYLSVMGRASFVATIIQNANGNPIAIETSNKSKLMVSQNERALFYADSAMEPLEYDGFNKLILQDAPTNYIDVRGPATVELVIDAVAKTVARPNYGKPNTLFLDLLNYAALSKAIIASGRFVINGSGNSLSAGATVRTIEAPNAGQIQLIPDLFLTDGRGDPDGTYNSSALGELGKRPGPPSVPTAIAASGSGSSFLLSYVGAYRYKIVACNSKGRSAPVSVGPITPTSGQNITVGITADPAQPAPTHYRVYRTAVGGAAGTERFVFRVAAAAVITTEVVITDTNAFVPGTTDAFLFSFNAEALMLKELLGMIRIPLGTIDTSVRWLQLYMCALQVMKPTHHMILRNLTLPVGTYT